MSEKLCIASNAVEMSEKKKYIEITNLMCYYDESNENGVKLLSEGALEKAETLIDMPVVARYKVVDGKPDFGSHEVSIDKKTKEVKFGTENVGVHTAVEIKDAEVEIHGEKKTLPCLFSKMKIWARNKNVVAAVKRLYEEGKLKTSWEISYESYNFSDNVKTILDYVFEANCLLGSKVVPAYSCAKILELAEANDQPENVSDLEIAEALAKDMDFETIYKEGNMEPEKTTVAEVEATTAENAEGTESSALTDYDLRNMIIKAFKNLKEYKNAYAYPAFLFVDEGYALFTYDGQEKELDFLKVSYTIENEVVTIVGVEESKLAVPVTKINEEIEKKDSEISALNSTIEELNGKIAELEPYKEKAEEAERQQLEAAKCKKKEELCDRATKGGYIKVEEFSSDENLKTMLENLDESGINSVIVDRMLASIEKSGKNQATVVSTVSDGTVVASTNLNDTDDQTSVSIIGAFLNKK